MTRDPAPLLSILLITFNHERYIERALEGVEMQRLVGDVEVIVADDASSDHTVGIIEAWGKRNERFKVRILSTGPNLGITRNYQRAFKAARATYVAILEGDDYWTSPDKLQSQLDFLDQHRECDLCGANYYVLDEAKAKFSLRVLDLHRDVVFGARDLIADNIIGNFSTCMYRRTALDQLPPELFAEYSYDWIINICIGTKGLIGFLHKPMSVYRIHPEGAWSGNTLIRKLEVQRDMLGIYDRITKGLYSDEFDTLRSHLDKAIAKPDASFGARLRRNFRDMFPPIVPYCANWLIPPLLRRIARQIFRSFGK
jgi:glycosyltransferase involved in cell wall biosynthesis